MACGLSLSKIYIVADWTITWTSQELKAVLPVVFMHHTYIMNLFLLPSWEIVSIHFIDDVRA